MNESTANKKPIGIVIIAIYTGLSAVLSLSAGVLALLLSQFVIVAGIISILMVAFGVLALATTYGLWTLQDWGYKFTKIVYIISIPLGLVALYFDTSMGNIVMQVFGIAVAVWILIYFLKPETKSLFVEQA